MQTENISSCIAIAVDHIGETPTVVWEKRLKKSVKVLDVCREIWDKHHAQRGKADEVVGKRSKTTEMGLKRVSKSVKTLYGSSLIGAIRTGLVIKKIIKTKPDRFGQKI